jgi:hypothetical protein
MRKGGRRNALAINPQTAARLRAYLDVAGHAGDSQGPMFRPLKHNGKQDAERRHMDPDVGFADSGHIFSSAWLWPWPPIRRPVSTQATKD